MNVDARAALRQVREPANHRRSLVRRLLDFVFGYDFFVSYAWSDGQVYAHALVRRLEQNGFDVFLDRDDFASGDDWKRVGGWTLRRTSQLILVGSPLARDSGPVAHELEIFAETQRRIVPIDFDGSLDDLEDCSPLARHLPPELLRIREPAAALALGPSDETLATIRQTFKIVRQDKKRVRVLAIVAAILGALAIAAVIFGVQASISEGRAQEATERAEGALAAEQRERERAVRSERQAERSAAAARAARDHAEDRQRFAEAQQRIAETQRRIADEQRRAAEIRQLAAEAGQRFTEAATHFARAETIGSASDIEMLRRSGLRDQIAALDLTAADENPDRLGMRLRNLEAEVVEAGSRLQELAEQGRAERMQGGARLAEADALWAQVQQRGGAAAGPAPFAPDAPDLFSIEVISVVNGQSLILHYGSPDAPRFVLVDGGGGGVFDNALRPRLEGLRQRWSPTAPLQLELVAISNQDDERLHGIMDLLQSMIERREQGVAPEYRINRIWHNTFGPTDPAISWQKMRARALIEQLSLPLNAPFDHLVMRPPAGRLTIELEGGLRATIIAPTESTVRQLYRDWSRTVEQRRERMTGSEDDRQPLVFPEERFSALTITHRDHRPVLGETALGELTPPGGGDRSLANLASLVILFEYGGRQFLHTGDARSDQIIAGLDAAGLLDASGEIRVDTLLIPHLGSERNVSMHFFRRVRARNYLFTGYGAFGNAGERTIEMLLEATPPEDCINLHFLNREGDSAMGVRLDAFFATLTPGRNCFRRVFRTGTREALTVDLVGRVRY